MKPLIYRWKAAANPTWLVLLLLLAVLMAMLLGDMFRVRGGPRRLAEAWLVLEVYLPLALAAFLAPLPPLERSAGMAEIQLTYRRPCWLRVLELTALALGLWAVAAGLSGWLVNQYYQPLSFKYLAKVALPPAAALGGVALAGSALLRSQVGGMLAAAIWWGADLVSMGGLQQWAYLFTSYNPRPDALPEVIRPHLLLIGAAGLALALWLAERRERWVSP